MMTFFLFSTSYFYRWKDGSCIEVAPVKYDKPLGGIKCNRWSRRIRFRYIINSSTCWWKTINMKHHHQVKKLNIYIHFMMIFDIFQKFMKLLSSTQGVVQNTINNMKKFLLKFRNFKHLWRTDKVR